MKNEIFPHFRDILIYIYEVSIPANKPIKATVMILI